MAKTTKEQLAVLARPFAEALVRSDDARRAAVIDHVTGGGRTVRLDRTTGTLSPVKVSIIDDSQVQVEPNDLSNARNLEEMLTDIVAYILALALPTFTDEQVRDVTATALLAGDGIGIAVDDAGDHITISATGSGGRYRHMVLTDDGAGGWGFVVATIDGQTWPVTAIAESE